MMEKVTAKFNATFESFSDFLTQEESSPEEESEEPIY